MKRVLFNLFPAVHTIPWRAFAFAAVVTAPAALAQVTVSVDRLDGSEPGTPVPENLVVIDVFVDVATTDVWTAAGMRGLAFNGASLVYRSEPGAPLLNPGVANRFVTCVSKPRLRDADARFNNARVALAGRYDLPGPTAVAASTEVNVAWFASPPETAGSPSFDGYIARVAIDISNAAVDRSTIVVAPAQPLGTIRLFESTPSSGTAQRGTVAATFDFPNTTGLNWGVYGVPAGACCTPGGCAFLSEARCQLAGGTFQGVGVRCGTYGAPASCSGAFEDISQTGTLASIASGCDDCGESVPIGFTFDFFDVPRTTVNVCSNGYLTFGSSTGVFENEPFFPSPNGPNDTIAPYWDDWNPSVAGDVYYRTSGSSPNRRFVVQWNHVFHFNEFQFEGQEFATFQAILFEGSNSIEFRYALTDPRDTPTIGIENGDGTAGVNVAAGGQDPCTSIAPQPDPCPGGFTTGVQNFINSNGPRALGAGVGPGNGSFAFNYAGAEFTPGRIRVIGDLTEIDTGTFASEARFEICTPSRCVATGPLSGIPDFTGTLHIDVTVPLPAGLTGTSTGTWMFEAFESVNDAGNPDAQWNNLTVQVIDAQTRCVPEWAETDKLTALDAAESDQFGFAMAVSGNTAVIGAIGDNSGAGSAYVFVRDPGGPGTWTQQAELTASDGTPSDFFGFSVAIENDTVVVGAVADNSSAGSAYVFVRSGTVWTQQQKLLPLDPGASDGFGGSVAIAGDTAVIGSSANDDVPFNSGSAYVFVRTGNFWTQQAKLTASDAAGGDLFGTAVSAAGDTAVITATGDDDGGTNSGSAYVFVRSGIFWTQQAKLTASDGAPGDFFGNAVSVDGDTVVIAARDDDDAGSGSGSVYVFVRSGTSWTQQAKLTALDAAGGDSFGQSVSVRGNLAVVGSIGDDDDGTNSGSAYLFARSGTVWTQQAKLTAPDAADQDQFGYSVALSGSTALAGAKDDDDAGGSSGSAYVFEPVDTDGDGIPDACDPGCAADFNGDNAVNSQDFFDFLAAFFAAAPAADANHDAVINSQDFFDFLSAFFAGCP